MVAARATVCLAATLLVGGAALGSGTAAGWREIAWPFPQDAWPAGRAFRCRSAGCGGDIEVYLRPKLGLCGNCATGVTGDAEVDGVSDVDMISLDFVPDAPGEPVVVGAMAGRVRRYTLRLPHGVALPSAGFAVSRRCDLFVAAMQGPSAGSAAAGRAVVALMESAPVARWIEDSLDNP